jgi:origin recognition complex subunit 5
LTVVFVVAYPSPLFLHKAGVPHIEFPSYDKAASISIVGRRPPPILNVSTLDNADDARGEATADDDLWLWQRFCGIVWDALGRGAARDLVHFRTICERLWPSFVQPIRDGAVGPRELSKLVNRTRALFQGEDALRESVVPIGASAAEDRKRIFKSEFIAYLHWIHLHISFLHYKCNLLTVHTAD